MKKILLILILILVSGGASWVQAHANLARSLPAANAALSDAPKEIRLWFTEPVEPAFSRILVRDATGVAVETVDAQVDATDAQQLVLPLTTLADGLYTVTWRTVSAADGHASEGSFAFGVNVPVSAGAAGARIDEAVTTESVLIRAFYFWAASLAVGSLGFAWFVWQPLRASSASAESGLRRLMLIGWGLLGVALVLVLLLQTSTTAAIPLAQALTHPALVSLVTQTLFGALWLARMTLWGVWGVLLLRRPSARAEMLACAMAFLLAQSLFSHASATRELTALLSDWLHLLATTLWVGGLIAFLGVLVGLRRNQEVTALTAHCVALFSNYARVCVALLIVTGVYAAWLHVGSVEALLGTRYGQALVIKLLLFAPLLVIAAVNLLLTQRQLERGRPAWVGRLRGLLGAEMTLACGVLLAAGVLTAGSPARSIQALREAAEAAQRPEAYFGMEASADMMIHLDVVPGVVGHNEFRVSLADMTSGEPINDASLIRLRFDHLDQRLGQSELRPVFSDNGAYGVTGSNLSAAGRWRVRVNIQRPGEFDTVKDFTLNVGLPPAAPSLDARPPLQGRLIASLLTGVALLIVGGFLGGWGQRPRLGGRVLAGAALAVGALCLVGAADVWMQPGTLTVSEAVTRPAQTGMTTAVYLTLHNESGQPYEIVGAAADVAERTSLHATRLENEVATMERLDSLTVAPFSTLEIAPGGTHIMLESLTQTLQVGQTFEMTLTLADGTTIPVTVRVEE